MPDRAAHEPLEGSAKELRAGDQGESYLRGGLRQPGGCLLRGQENGAAIKQCNKAIAIDDTSAAFFNNLGAAYFAEKKFEPAVTAYQHALELDPDVFARSSRRGIEAQLAGPEDRARFDYTVAKLYAKIGFSEQSLEYLKKAMEAGYKDLKNVYKDQEFAELRKNPRFTELMATKMPVIPD